MGLAFVVTVETCHARRWSPGVCELSLAAALLDAVAQMLEEWSFNCHRRTVAAPDPAMLYNFYLFPKEAIPNGCGLVNGECRMRGIMEDNLD